MTVKYFESVELKAAPPADTLVTVSITLKESQRAQLAAELGSRIPQDIAGYNMALYNAFKDGKVK